MIKIKVKKRRRVLEKLNQADQVAMLSKKPRHYSYTRTEKTSRVCESPEAVGLQSQNKYLKPYWIEAGLIPTFQNYETENF